MKLDRQYAIVLLALRRLDRARVEPSDLACRGLRELLDHIHTTMKGERHAEAADQLKLRTIAETGPSARSVGDHLPALTRQVPPSERGKE